MCEGQLGVYLIVMLLEAFTPILATGPAPSALVPWGKTVPGRQKALPAGVSPVLSWASPSFR